MKPVEGLWLQRNEIDAQQWSDEEDSENDFELVVFRPPPIVPFERNEVDAQQWSDEEDNVNDFELVVFRPPPIVPFEARRPPLERANALVEFSPSKERTEHWIVHTSSLNESTNGIPRRVRQGQRRTRWAALRRWLRRRFQRWFRL